MPNTLGLVSLQGLYVEATQFTYLGATGLNESHVGKVVAIDTTAANTVKLAGDGDRILGVLQAVEVRTQDGVITCTVAHNGGFKLAVNPNATASGPDETPDIGDFLEGGTSNTSVKGFVQKLQSGTSRFQVVEVLDAGANVVAIAV